MISLCWTIDDYNEIITIEFIAGAVKMTDNLEILLVEDDSSILEALTIFLQRNKYSVYGATKGEEALLLLHKHSSISLAIVDIMLPGMSGFEVLKKIRDHSNLPIIILSARGQEWDKEQGYLSGTDDYVTKPFSLKELHFRIEALLRRSHMNAGTTTEQPILSYGELTINVLTRQVLVRGTLINLTRKEFDLLFLLASHPNIVFNRTSLLDRVWKDDLTITDRTVDSHIKNIRKSLGEESMMIRTVWGVGYAFEYAK
ncbi:winged helix family two component transcriptional regulator [Paenibacillus algicola]|uniref:Winged helix family two component transcriptional regulator n=2 Tax=Paenibacillus TaxID=44249 RepID=A0A4P8XGY9_9BACL|nr:winged helix family two component transcriptional regulator [Paenibacillus algicola]